MTSTRDYRSRHDFPSRLGRVFLLAAWTIAVLVLALFFEDVLQGLRNPNRDPRNIQSPDGRSAIVLQRNNRGHYVASGRVNGAPVDFLVDTGATNVALPAAVARRLGIKGGATLVSHTANGTTTGQAARLDSVAIGGLVLHQVPAIILPNLEGPELLLGMSFLKRLDLVQRGDTLILSAPN